MGGGGRLVRETNLEIPYTSLLEVCWPGGKGVGGGLMLSPALTLTHTYRQGGVCLLGACPPWCIMSPIPVVSGFWGG